MTNPTARPVRPVADFYFPELAAAIAVKKAHEATRPLDREHNPGWSAYVAKYRELDQAANLVRIRVTRGIVCANCYGGGVIEWGSNKRDVCGRCGGDGWTAKGRKMRDAGKLDH